MFDLELECTVGVGGGGRARRCLPEEAVEESVYKLLLSLPILMGRDKLNSERHLSESANAMNV